jgi:hypothetical protein
VICTDHAVGPDFLRFIGLVYMANRRITFIRLDSNNFFDHNVFPDVFRLSMTESIGPQSLFQLHSPDPSQPLAHPSTEPKLLPSGLKFIA